ncbi:MAG: cyclic nucleotide-binding domain-containing protein [Casimicrobiaceae bacterium]
MLRNVPLFSGLSDSELKLLAFTGRVLRFEPGETLMRQGERADCAYVILEGEVEIMGEAAGGSFLIAVQGKNALVGEMGIICDAPRSATVRAKTPARALCISGEMFLRLACENPQRALYVMRQLSTRLAAENIAHAALREELRQIKAAAKGGH